jgi:flagellar motor switch protein FliN/FliY
MRLHELLKLSPGSKIGFEVDPRNPVDVLVNGRLVARGTAVVMEGHYGVRIAEIVANREPAPSGSAHMASLGVERDSRA